MRVFVIGAAGFIGHPVAQAYVRAGHDVLGLTRSDKTATKLAAEEITPVIGDAGNPSSWISKIENVDIVIDASGGPSNELAGPILEAIKDLATRTRPHGPALTFIYTSGTWVNGDNRTEGNGDLKTDGSPLVEDKAIPLVKWRVTQERIALSTQTASIRSIVIRPGLLYGSSGSLLHGLFDSASKGEVKWPGEPKKGEGRTWGTIHQQDLADLYLRAGEKASIAAGQAFVAINPVPESTEAIFEKLVKLTNAKGPTYTPITNAFEEALGSSQKIRPTLARSLLGWEPRRPLLTDAIELYYEAWKANQSLGA